MKSSAHESESLVKVFLPVVTFVLAGKLNAAGEELPDVKGRRHDISTLVCDVVLHARFLVNGKLSTLIDRTAESPIVLAGVLVLGVVLGIVDVVFGTVATKTIGSNLKLARAEAEGQEAQDTKEQADGLCGNSLDGTDVDGLGVVTKPIAKVDARDHQLIELLATKGAGHGQGEESIFDIAVTPFGNGLES